MKKLLRKLFRPHTTVVVNITNLVGTMDCKNCTKEEMQNAVTETLVNAVRSAIEIIPERDTQFIQGLHD